MSISLASASKQHVTKKSTNRIFVQVKLKVPKRRLMLQSRHEDAICGRVDAWSYKKVDLRPGLEHIASIGGFPLSQ